MPAVVIANQVPVQLNGSTDTIATGNITANGQTVSVSTQGSGVASFIVTGTWSGTLQFEYSIDGTNWSSASSFIPNGAQSSVTSTTANGSWQINSAGFNEIRVRASAWSSGTATVTYEVGPGSTVNAVIQGAPNTVVNAWPVEVTDGTNVLGTSSHPVRTDPTGTTTQPVSGTVTSNIGTTNGLALDATLTGGTQRTKITDGTNNAAVKAASTAPVAADPSLVITVSPNSPAQSVSGTVTSNQGTANTVANSWPVEVTDGTNVLGTSSHPVRIDPTGTTTQPVSGTVTSNIGTTNGLALDATLTGGTQRTKITDGTNNAAVKAASTAPVAADPSLVVTVSPNSPAQSVSGTVTANQGTANTVANSWPVEVTDGTNVLGTSSHPVRIDPTGTTTQPISGTVTVSNTPSGITPTTATGYISVAAITSSIVRSTVYTEQFSNFTGSVSSASASDTSSGTGARTIRIFYMDSTLTTSATEDVTLNGTTAVNLVNTNHCFIEKIVVLTTGSSGSNTGVISLFTGSGGTGTTVGSIAANDSTTYWAHHYVLSGKTCNVSDLTMSSNITSAAATGYALKTKSVTATTPIETILDQAWTAGGQNAFFRTYPLLLRAAGPVRVSLWANSPVSTSQVYKGAFSFYDQ